MIRKELRKKEYERILRGETNKTDKNNKMPLDISFHLIFYLILFALLITVYAVSPICGVVFLIVILCLHLLCLGHMG